jgi:arylsulfatase A-like enzyme
VELLLAVTLPRLWVPESELLAWQWPVIGILCSAYAITGLVLGAAGGALLAGLGKNRVPARHETVAGLTLATAFAANLAYAWPLARSEQIALVVAAGLAATFGFALISDAWQKRTAFLSNPWIVSVLLLCSPWISREALSDRPAPIKTGVSLLALALFTLLAAVKHRIRFAKPVPIHRKAATLVAAAAALYVGANAGGATADSATGQPAAAAAPGKPNILLISMDTVRADHLSVYGYERDTTPRLREFAREATVYDRAVAASDMTLPSHASMFTGLYPSWHGAYPAAPDFAYGRPLATGATTLAGLLREKGYWTAAVVANHSFLQQAMGLAQGFATWKHNIAAHLSATDRPFYMREGARTLLGFMISTGSFDGYFLRAADINHDAFAVLEGARSRGPFFLFLNYMDAHIPLVPPAPYRDLFPGRDLAFRPAARHQDLTNTVNAGKGKITEGEKRHLLSQYDGAISYVDSEMARLFARMRELGVYDNTLILITSDHGEAFGEHDLMQHGIGSVYEEEVHVPLLVKFPGQRQSRRSNAVVSHVDIMPTALDAAGVSAPAGLHGRSLNAQEGLEAQPVFAEAWPLGGWQINPRMGSVRRAVFSGPAKLITPSTGSPELYDLRADPGELTNLYRADDPLSASLTSRMTAWTSSIPRRLKQPAKPDKSTMDRIKSLGYTQ